MSLKNEILNYLSVHGDEYISGEALAKKFNKSRTAVWKAVKSLQNDGIKIASCKSFSLASQGVGDIFLHFAGKP